MLSLIKPKLYTCPVSWGCRIHRLHLGRGVRRAWTQIWVQDKLGSSGPYCTKWADDSIVKQGSSFGSCPTFPPLNPLYNRPSGHWPCVKSCLVGSRDKYQRKTPPKRVLDMTLSNPVVRFQWCWGFGEYRVLFHCHRSHVHSVPERKHLIGSYLWVK